VKPGKPLKRKTPLVSRTPLVGSTPMQRASRLTRKAMEKRRPKVSPEQTSCRKAVKARSESVCEIHGGHPAHDLHHRLNRSQGGLWTPANIIHICREAHAAIGADPLAAAHPSRGWSIRNRRNPADVPIWLAGRGYCFLHDNGHVTEASEEEEIA
jgi:hypothetical protein